MEMTQHEQQAESLFEEWDNNSDFSPSEGRNMIAFAAFCLEKSGWKKYPEEKPEKDGWYAIQTSSNTVIHNCTFYHDWEFFWDRMGAIAFMPIPEYKP